MKLSINKNLQPLRFRFENTKHKLGVRIWGDRRSFHELHELLGECWDCENADMSRAEGCSNSLRRRWSVGAAFSSSTSIR